MTSPADLEAERIRRRSAIEAAMASFLGGAHRAPAAAQADIDAYISGPPAEINAEIAAAPPPPAPHSPPPPARVHHAGMTSTEPAGSTAPAPAGSARPAIDLSEARARDAVTGIATLATSLRRIATEISTAGTAASGAPVTGPADTAGAQALLTEIATEIAALVSSAATDAGTAAESASATATAAAALLDRELGIAEDGAIAIGAVGGPA